MAPLWLPDGYEQAYIKMTKDYLLGADSIFVNYEDHAKHSEMFVLISKITDLPSGTIEKDDRPVIEYTKENTTWYIMHNLQQIMSHLPMIRFKRMKQTLLRDIPKRHYLLQLRHDKVSRN